MRSKENIPGVWINSLDFDKLVFAVESHQVDPYGCGVPEKGSRFEWMSVDNVGRLRTSGQHCINFTLWGEKFVYKRKCKENLFYTKTNFPFMQFTLM